MTKVFMNLNTQELVKKVYDPYPDSPREWDNLGTLYTWEDRCYSPDKHNYPESLDFLSELLTEETVYKVHDKYNNTHDFLEDIMKRLDKIGYILFPVYKYEHGLVRYGLGTSSGWDSGTVGVIFASKKKIYQEFKVKRITKEIRNKVVKLFEGELETYTDYANGEVYGYIVESFDGTEIDSCYGFYNFDMTINDVNDYFGLSDFDNWKEYNQEEIDEKFYIYNKTIVESR